MPKYRIKRNGMHEQALKSRKKIKVIAGGFGNGKTAFAVVQAIMLAKDYPGSNGIVAMATYAQVNDTIRKELYKWMPANQVQRWPTTANNTLIMKNGSQINFRYIQQKGKTANTDGVSFSNLLSATYDWAVIDQIEDPRIKHKDFLDIMGRLRGSTPYRGKDSTMPKTGPRWLILTANPSFNWVFHKLVKPFQIWKETGERTEDLIWDKENNEPLLDVFEGSTYENSSNLDADFISGLESVYTGQFRKRFLEGQWGAFEGLVYPQFSKSYHMIKKSDIINHIISCRSKGLKTFKAIEGYDYGLAEPACYLIGFTDDYGRFFILDGFYKEGLSLFETGNRIITLRRQYEGLLNFDEEYSFGDPAIFKRTVIKKEDGTATSIADLLYDDFKINFRAGQNDIDAGIAKISNYLSVENYYNLYNDTLDSPLIYISNQLSFIAEEMGEYFWQTNASTGTRIDKPIDGKDHSLDTIKYMMSALPQALKLLYLRNTNTLGYLNERRPYES